MTRKYVIKWAAGPECLQFVCMTKQKTSLLSQTPTKITIQLLLTAIIYYAFIMYTCKSITN